MKNRGFRNSYGIEVLNILILIALLLLYAIAWHFKNYPGIYLILAGIIIFETGFIHIEFGSNLYYTRTFLIDTITENELDLNIESQFLMNIARIYSGDTDKVLTDYTDYKYIRAENYVCFGDSDIQHFVKEISKGISMKNSYKVFEQGFNRVIMIDYLDINKRAIVYLINLPNIQLISFKKLKQAQLLGIKTSNTNSETYKVDFVNKANKYEKLNIALIALIFAFIIVWVYNPFLYYYIDSSIITIGLGIWLLVFLFNRYKINKIVKLPKDVVELVSKEKSNPHKENLINEIFDAIIKNYSLENNKEYLKELFDQNGFIYGDDKIFCRTNDEFDLLVKNSLKSIKDEYKINFAYPLDGSREAAVVFKNRDIVILMSIKKMDEGQIIKIS